MTSGDLLRVNSVSKTYRRGGLFSANRIHAVTDVSLSMGRTPSILSLVGESGSGKTTLAKLILRLETPDAGSIHLDEQPIFEKGARALSSADLRRQVQSIAQLPFDAFSALLPVDYYLRRTAINLTELSGQDDVDEAMDAALQNVGLSLGRIVGKYPHQFSGGELQRLSIARALIPKPKLIVADEPVSMVDASVRMNIINLFREIRDKRDISFLYVTHDLSTAHYLSDEILIMRTGEIVEQGAPDAVFAAPKHPYTRQLIESIPRIGERWSELADDGGDEPIGEPAVSLTPTNQVEKLES